MDTYGRLMELLDERGLTLYQASKLCNLSRSTLTNARNRGGQLSVDTIERICDALGITLSEFFAVERQRSMCSSLKREDLGVS